MDLKVTEMDALATLSSCDWDLETATELALHPTAQHCAHANAEGF